ncbi:ATP-binding cassette domain-containing protein [Streptococcus thermophilus]|uniref:ATP-binding cassette domain-containing protein n=1 Tax=Streptococcus thermophilus TaxID=1308 RepID=UPI000825A6B5|nr:ABC transporter ATP-binding protein [Streptococcus thermophilus]AOD25727.1 ABC transporter ATP-binding protein [Streptococcus thermophilus]MDA3770609.1 ABC transporter ATP-binding protein [Streptococcus thermophilus]
MGTIFRHISKTKLFFYLLFSLLYSLQGLLTSFLIQGAGKVDVNDNRMILIFGLSGVLLFVFIYACMYVNNILARAIIEEFNVLISKKAIETFYQRTLQYSPSELNSFLAQDIPMFWQEYLAPLIIYPIFGLSILASVFYLLIQHIQLGLMFTVGGFLMIIPQFIFHKMLKRRGEELSKARENSMASITDFTKGIDTIRSSQASHQFSAHVLDAIKNTERKQYHYFISHNLVMFWTGPLKGIGLVIPLMIGLFLMRTTSLTLTTLLAMMTASMNLISPLQQLLEGTSSLQSSTAIRDKVVSILQLSDGFTEVEEKNVEGRKLCIDIDHLSKSFGEKNLFQQLSLNIPFGKKILLTGASGSGKSTLFKLLSGEDTEFSGTISFESENGMSFKPSYDCVSVIHQKPYIFNGSLRDNVTLFQDFSDSSIIDVLQKVNLLKEVGNNLELYLDGQNLSGGQMMKLELARALLRLKPILLVDEVTASLDDTNAKEIRQLIYSQDCTIIEIAHKFNKDNYDEVIKLEDYRFRD